MTDGLSFVYWIHLESHTDVNSEGYIGVSNNVDKRFREHLNHSTNKHLNENIRSDSIAVDIIFSGSPDECFKLELDLRPKWNVGWNIAPGGVGGTFKQKTESHKRNIAKALKGKIRSPDHSQRISEAKKGKPQSAESNAKRSASALGKKRGPYSKYTHRVTLDSLLARNR